jgi:hypothetical protein
MIRIVLILVLLVISIYIIYKFFPKLKLLLLRVIKSPFIFLIIKNLIRLILRRF